MRMAPCGRSTGSASSIRRRAPDASTPSGTSGSDYEWDSRINSIRGPGVRNIDLSRTMAVGKVSRVQVKVEIFNLMNRPTFANPGNTNVSNLILNADGTVRDLDGFGVGPRV